MTAFGWLSILGIVVLVLVGYILLQRRKPEVADAIAKDLDTGARKAEEGAAKIFGKITGKKPPPPPESGQG